MFVATALARVDWTSRLRRYVLETAAWSLAPSVLPTHKLETGWRVPEKSGASGGLGRRRRSQPPSILHTPFFQAPCRRTDFTVWRLHARSGLEGHPFLATLARHWLQTRRILGRVFRGVIHVEPCLSEATSFRGRPQGDKKDGRARWRHVLISLSPSGLSRRQSLNSTVLFGSSAHFILSSRYLLLSNRLYIPFDRPSVSSPYTKQTLRLSAGRSQLVKNFHLPCKQASILSRIYSR